VSLSLSFFASTRVSMRSGQEEISHCRVTFSFVSIFKLGGSSQPKMGFFLIILYSIVPFICFLFYFFRSTNAIPKNWRELKSEVLTIFEGMMSQNQDFLLRKRNRISEFGIEELSYGHVIVLASRC
jgi:RsiW-degrading membrane proteinase PrsW (M82 family)